MAKTVTTRLPDEYVMDLETIEKAEKLDTSSVIRRLLANAIAEWKKNYAVEKYRKGEFSFGQVAKFADVTVWDVPDLLKGRGVPLNMDIEEFEKELKTIRWKQKKRQ
ncbi:MAG TPA: UPF0175 family protein [Candidatus Nanoarchaeia archaeon]|nr:UPF0175 family protein [Candidatus Nanoarchaeia archaeon]